MPRLSLVTGVVGRNEITRRWLDTTYATCTTDPEVVVVCNGSTVEEVAELVGWLQGRPATIDDHPEPMGSTRAFATGVSLATGDVIAAIQNDLLIDQVGWDQLLLDFITATSRVGVVGVAGAKGFASPDIYHVAYHFTQLGRWEVYSSLVNWQCHGKEATAPIRVVVLDGIVLCFRKDAYTAWGGYDLNLIHHMYDMDLSLSAHRYGLRNFVIPLSCEHLNGQTSNCSERYARMVEPMGGDIGVHQEAHRYMYTKWRGHLPVSVP